jgi:hypothetical protein
MIDRGVVDGRLDNKAAAEAIRALQVATDFDDGDRALVTQDDRPASGAPAVEERASRPLFDQLDQRGAGPGAVHSRQYLARSRARCRDRLDSQVLEAGTVEHEGAHVVWDLEVRRRYSAPYRN